MPTPGDTRPPVGQGRGLFRRQRIDGGRCPCVEIAQSEAEKVMGSLGALRGGMIPLNVFN